MNGQEDEKMKEWTTIADVVTTEEIMHPGYEIQRDCNFREFAIYLVYNANEAQTTSGYIRTELTDINGKSVSVQSMAGVPKSGYYRCVFHIILGNIINLFDVKASSNTSLTPISMYEGTETVLSNVIRIKFMSYANLGVGSKIKIMAR